MKMSVRELMVQSGVAFGTSGARGLATAMTDQVCYAYTCGFLQYLESIGELKRSGEAVAIGGDFRPSTDRIMLAVCRAAQDLGYQPVNCGKVPSPAVALFGLENQIPSIMITGSHIPDDRNGIKFNKVSGEILKDDESGMSGQIVQLNDSQFTASGSFARPATSEYAVSPAAGEQYIARYLNFFEPTSLHGMRLGVYQHSAVARDVLVRILSGLGATVTPLGRSDKFIPVDTEAIRPEDVQLAADWATAGQFDAIVSADGDSDRPLISDEHGHWLRGDIAGILCAKYLSADSVSTPVSCNTAIEKCGWFPEIRRTRIGSPFVVASMLQATRTGAKRVVGYEANGGFLLNSDITVNNRRLRSLPTRDAVIVMLGILLLARQEGKKISALAASLPPRFTASDRLKNFPTEKSREILARFDTGADATDKNNIGAVFGELAGKVASINRTDGLRIIFNTEEVIHLRPSGNAPEFRCYTEAATDDRAERLNKLALEKLKTL